VESLDSGCGDGSASDDDGPVTGDSPQRGQNGEDQHKGSAGPNKVELGAVALAAKLAPTAAICAVIHDHNLTRFGPGYTNEQPVFDKLLRHYLKGGGEPFTLDEDDVRRIEGTETVMTTSIGPKFPEFYDALFELENAGGGTKSLRLTRKTSGSITLGTFTEILTGELTVWFEQGGKRRHWMFEGRRSLYDVWDFDVRPSSKASKRDEGDRGEVKWGTALPGKGFEVMSVPIPVSSGDK
jgi:hypothetical protein